MKIFREDSILYSIDQFNRERYAIIITEKGYLSHLFEHIISKESSGDRVVVYFPKGAILLENDHYHLESYVPPHIVDELIQFVLD